MKKINGELLLVITTIIWGTTFAISKTALDLLSPYSLLAIRFSMATILGLLLFWKSITKITKQELMGGLILGVFLTGGFVFQFIGLQYTTASKAAFLTGLAVVFVPFFDRLTGVKINLNTKVAVILAIVGTAMLSFERGQIYGISQGDFLIILCAVCFAGYIFVLDKIANKGNTYCYTVVQIGVTTVVSWILALTLEGVPVLNDVRLGLEILYLALFATILTTIFQTVGQKKVNGQRAAVIFTLEPAFGAIFAFILVNETFTLIQFAGALVIFFAILYNETNGLKIKSLSKGINKTVG